MEKELTTEEKKELYMFCKMSRNMAEKYSYETDIKKLEEMSAPLFFTSIDNVPMWDGDECFIIYPELKITGFYLKKDSSYFRTAALKECGTASTREACEQWIADNRSISVKNCERICMEMVNIFHGQMSWTNEDAFKSVFESKLKEISK